MARAGCRACRRARALQGPDGLLGEELLQLARLVHLLQDVAAADEFAVDVELRNRRPVRVFLDALPDFRVLQHVDRVIVGRRRSACRISHRGRRKAALRKLRRALHVQHDPVAA